MAWDGNGTVRDRAGGGGCCRTCCWYKRGSWDTGRARQATLASQAALSCASRTISARSAASELNLLRKGRNMGFIRGLGRTTSARSAASELNFLRTGSGLV